MPLLEIVLHKGTSKQTAAAAMEVGVRQGKTPIFVNDGPGFFTTRTLAPYLTEVTALLADGCDLEQIDKALKAFGMPVGPITLMDETGIDVCVSVGKVFRAGELGPRVAGGGRPELLAKMAEGGFLGRKAGKGWYLYPKDAKKGAAKQVNPAVSELLKGFVQCDKKLSVENIQMRLVGRLINEAAYCVQDNVLRSTTDGDIGCIFGLGFPPFLGGPFRFIDSYGAQKFVDLMSRYRDENGTHFEPCQLLKDYATGNKKFYSK